MLITARTLTRAVQFWTFLAVITSGLCLAQNSSAFFPQGTYCGPPLYFCAATVNAAFDVLQAPSLGGITSNNALVTDSMLSGAKMFRFTDTTTQTGANADYVYNVPCGGSADNNEFSRNRNFFIVEDSGGAYFARYINPSGNNSLPLYPNFSLAKGNYGVNCGEFSYNSDTIYIDHGTQVSGLITQINFAGYNSPSLAAPSALPTQTTLANFANVIGGTPTWHTLGGMNRLDNVNSNSFMIAEAYSTTGGQGTGCINAVVTINGANPVPNNDTYSVYNSCTGVVTNYAYNGTSWVGTTVGTVSIDDKFCTHNLKYHGGYTGNIGVISSTRSAPCTFTVTGNGANYYFWVFYTDTVIPCVACDGHETENVASFLGSYFASNSGANIGVTPYLTAAAGIVSTSGTSMTFVSGIPPSSAMNGQVIAINGAGYTASGCTSTGCALSASAGTQTNVRYWYPAEPGQDSGSLTIPALIKYPTLWNVPDCTGTSFPFSNEPCTKAPDTHLSSNDNPGNDTGMVFYATTSVGLTGLARGIGQVSISGNTVTLLYGNPFASYWVGHNIVLNGKNCQITGYTSATQITVSCP
jgi:hypothetical protein